MTKKEIADIRKLQQKKYRQELGCFAAEGDKAIEEIIHGGLNLKKLYITESSKFTSNRSLSKELISKEEMSKISFLQTSTPAFALFEIPQQNSKYRISNEELTLVLDEVQDPGNLGTIIRLADWFGITTIVCSKSTADCFNPKVVQATMGAISRINVIYAELEPLMERALNEKIPIFGTFMEGENIYTAELPKNGVLVMGNEGSGISEPIERLISRKITIPSFKKENVESLNVAIATSICCSEFRRRTN